jgi:hypothetical protein
MIDATFQSLRERLQALEEALDALGTTVENDAPAGDPLIVVSRLNDAVLAARGYLQEPLSTIDDARHALRYPSNIDAARQALVKCQERFLLFSKCFSEEIASYERWDDLSSIGRRRGREWLGWVSVVQETVQQCRGLIDDVTSALFLCWQELAERLSAASVQVRNVA